MPCDLLRVWARAENAVVVLLLDTSFLVALEVEIAERRAGPALRLLGNRPLEPVAVGIVALAEFAEGFEDLSEVEAFCARFKGVLRSRAIAYRCAALQRRIPQRLSENDAWMAATALVYGAELVGRERTFARVPRLRYVAF